MVAYKKSDCQEYLMKNNTCFRLFWDNFSALKFWRNTIFLGGGGQNLIYLFSLKKKKYVGRPNIKGSVGGIQPNNFSLELITNPVVNTNGKHTSTTTTVSCYNVKLLQANDQTSGIPSGLVRKWRSSHQELVINIWYNVVAPVSS